MKEKESDIDNSFLERISRNNAEESSETAAAIAVRDSFTNNPRKSSSSVLFYISSMGWINFLAFTVLVGVEVATNGIQRKFQLSIPPAMNRIYPELTVPILSPMAQLVE